MNIEVFELIKPTEENGYCVFDANLENDQYVFFHMAPASNKEDIITNGFKSARELGIGDLESVSYAKRSSGCFATLGSCLEDDHIIFAVRFQPVALREVAINQSDIHVYKKHLQPEMLGVVHLPAGFRLS